jgi:hypothetical protein
MGGGLGHVVAMAKIVQAMAEQGNRVTCILNDVSHARRLLGPIASQWLAAPRIHAAVRRTPPLNHADALHNAGYDNSLSLVSLLAAWRTMFFLLKPDRVVCDYAPTARLAANTLGIETVCIDNGFSMPPLSDNPHDPLPHVRTSVKPAPGQLAESERRVLDVVNGAMDDLGCDPLDAFSRLFREKVWYRNWVDFNHFGPHSPERHLGPIFGDGGKADPVWPAGRGPKLFAYLKPEHPGSLRLLQAAVARGYRVLAYLPGFSRDALRDLVDSGLLAASPDPVNLDKLPDDVEAGIWHSPMGGIGRCLDKGMRMIFLPMNSEQNLACSAARRSGLPVHLHNDFEDEHDLLDAMRAAPRIMRGDRWAPADPADFAHKLVSS